MERSWELCREELEFFGQKLDEIISSIEEVMDDPEYAEVVKEDPKFLKNIHEALVDAWRFQIRFCECMPENDPNRKNALDQAKKRLKKAQARLDNFNS